MATRAPWSYLFSALLTAVVGAGHLQTGQAGQRLGYSHGANVRIGGLALLILGIGMIVHWAFIRKRLQEKAKPPHDPRTGLRK